MHQTVQAIYTYLKQGGHSRVLFTTNLLKNLPVDDLRRAYEQDGHAHLFDREVLFLRATADTVLDALGKQAVPVEFQTEAYHALETACQKYLHYRTQPGDAPAELAKALHKSIRTELEPAFRREVEACLRKAFPNDTAARRTAIRKRKRYQWIAAFYSEVFWSDYKVLLLSVEKLMGRSVPIVEPGFDFLSDRMLQGTILCIDESDASRAEILNSLIEESLKLRADYLQLFLQVYKGIRMHPSSRDLEALRDRYEKGRTPTWQNLLDQAKAIYQDGALQYSIKTIGSRPDQGRNFLFHDTSYLTVLDGQHTHIRAV